MKENAYEFRFRHWQYHRPGMRRAERMIRQDETLITAEWAVGCAPDAPQILLDAAKDFQDYLLTSMGLSCPVVREKRPRVLWLSLDPALSEGFVVETTPEEIGLRLAAPDMAFRAVVHVEDCMNLEGIPALSRGKMVRKPLYLNREVHSGCGIDDYPDAELAATIHAGYDTIALMLKDFDRCSVGPVKVNDLIERAERFGIKVAIFNYMETWVHPEEAGAQEKFDRVYGELFRRYPKAVSICLCGESLQFPSRDPATTGKSFRESVIDGIPDTRPAPGWYPCYDYPAYIQCIERAVHKVNPDAVVSFSTYNWGWAPLEIRKKFLEHFPKNVILSVCYEIFSQRTLEGLHTPVMDYTISAAKPGYYFQSECSEAARLGIPVQGNVNTAGVCWDFGVVPYVPVPRRWLERDRILRDACLRWGVTRHYCTHHYGWWACVAADLGKWSSWKDFEPDYEELLRKIAVRDYGKTAAPHVLKAWDLWSRAMDHYVASNEDQYGPWRVGAAYPFIFHPNITRTMLGKEIEFPADPQAHFGGSIVKAFYQPYENENQTPGFLRYPAELRSLAKMLDLWEAGLEEARACCDTPEGMRLEALGHFIRNSIRTTMNVKRWWQLNVAMVNCPDAVSALKKLDEIEALAYAEIENAKDTIPCVECDSRLGWEPSMEYVCDKWHLEWKIRQVQSALREIAAYRNTLEFSK